MTTTLLVGCVTGTLLGYTTFTLVTAYKSRRACGRQALQDILADIDLHQATTQAIAVTKPQPPTRLHHPSTHTGRSLKPTEHRALTDLAKHTHTNRHTTTAGRRLADKLRRTLPTLTDTELAITLLHTHHTLHQEITLTGDPWDTITTTLATLATAALELTELERTKW